MRIDCHNDTVGFLRNNDSLERQSGAHLDFERLRTYLDCSFFAVFIDQKKYAADLSGEFSRMLGLLKADIAQAPGVELLLNGSQLDTDPPEKSLILLSMEGASPLGDDGELLDEYYAAGLRALGLTWNYATPYAGGAREGGGVTAAGRRLISRCNDLGILLDGAHASHAAFSDLLRLSRSPIIDSHTVCAAFGDDFGRALTDEELRALAAKGGVAAITFVADFLGAGGSLDRLCEHIEYAVSLIGSEHVGLGADYDGAKLAPELAGVQFLPALYGRLRQRGMAEPDLENVKGNSVRRLLRQVLPR